MSLREARERLMQESVCAFEARYRAFDEDDRATLNEWIGENRTVHWMHVACAAAGIRVAEKTIRKHLQGYCHCPEGTELKGVYLVTS